MLRESLEDFSLMYSRMRVLRWSLREPESSMDLGAENSLEEMGGKRDLRLGAW